MTKVTIFFLFAILASASATWQWEVTVDVFEGTLQGFFGSESFPALKACANETVDAYDQIKDAIAELESNSPSGVKTGLQDLGVALGDLKNALTDCKASSEEIKEFAQTIENGFEHPLSFVWHLGKDLVVNGKDIFNEINDAITLWKEQSYRDSGIQIGKALALLIIGEDEVALVGGPSQWEATLELFEGTLEGFFESSAFPDLKNCANETVGTYDHISDAIAELETKTPEGVKKGLQDLGAALGDLTSALQDCKATIGEIKQFAITIENGFKNPMSFAFHIGKDLVVNGKDIFNEITAAITFWKTQDYKNTGIEIGKALALLIVGETQ